MKVDLTLKLPRGISLKDLKIGQPFAYTPPGEQWLEAKPYIAGPWVGLDDPHMRHVTSLETGQPLQWRDSVQVRPIENSKFIGEVTVG